MNHLSTYKEENITLFSRDNAKFSINEYALGRGTMAMHPVY